jgi:hypothetical protein
VVEGKGEGEGVGEGGLMTPVLTTAERTARDSRRSRMQTTTSNAIARRLSFIPPTDNPPNHSEPAATAHMYNPKHPPTLLRFALSELGLNHLLFLDQSMLLMLVLVGAVFVLGLMLYLPSLVLHTH